MQAWLQRFSDAAEACGAPIVAGDTKVIDRRGASPASPDADGLFINTAGVGLIEHDRAIAPRSETTVLS